MYPLQSLNSPVISTILKQIRTRLPRNPPKSAERFDFSEFSPVVSEITEPLLPIQDVPTSADSMILFINESSKNLIEKGVKKHPLIEIAEFVATVSPSLVRFSESVIVSMGRMCAAKLFRVFPPNHLSNSNWGGNEDDEDKFDPAWLHLQNVYDILLEFVTSSYLDSKVAKKTIDHYFILRLLEGFDSAGPRERKCLQIILHRIYKNTNTSYYSNSIELHGRMQRFELNINTHDLYYAELQQKMQHLASLGQVKKARKALNCMRYMSGKPSVYDYNSLIDHYLKSGNNVDLNQVVVLYDGLKQFGLNPNAITFNILINGMLKTGGNSTDYLSVSMFVLEEMCFCKYKPKCKLLSKMLKKMIGVGVLDDALRVMEIMLSLEYIPTQPVLNKLTSKLCEIGRIQDAYFMLSALLEKGYFYSAYCYNPILWALCKSKQINMAMSLFYLLKRKGFVHNVYSYTALVYGFSNEYLWVEAFQCLREMQNYGCSPSLITYTILAKALCNDERVDEALALLDVMETKGCEPDLIIYNVILRGLCLESRNIDIDKLLQVIDQKGLSPDPYTCSALYGCLLSVGEVDTVKKLLHEIISMGGPVDDAVYNIYIRSLCRSNNSSTALSFVKENHFQPNNVSYNTILDGYCRQKNIDEALDLLDHFDWVGNGPDVVSFNTILSAACKERNSSMVRRIINRMEYEGMKLNVVSFTCLIQYSFKVGDIPKGLKYLENMTREGHSPNIVTLNMVLNMLCKNGLLTMAHHFFIKLRNDGYALNVTSYNILIHTAIRWRKGSLVNELLKDMYGERLKHDAVTYGSLIKGLCKEGKISSALQLRDHMLKNGFAPSIAIYNTIMEEMLMRGKYWDIELLLENMIINDCKPNMVSIDILNRVSSRSWLKESPKFAKLLEFVICSCGEQEKRPDMNVETDS